ncbi:MAG: right-handed parallel beta-helix repeat-containing protein [Candidatus Thorarchaeota archaeon]
MKNPILVAFLILFTLTPIAALGPYYMTETSLDRISSNQYLEHLPIYIVDDNDFSLLGFVGSGTEADPYIIERFNISNAPNGISISGTSVYFVIRDCIISGTASSGAGIRLDSIGHGRVESCVIQGGQFGVELQNCDHITVVNNTIVASGDYGLRTSNGEFVNISSNRLFANDIGIGVSSTDNSTIKSNLVYTNSRIGIEIGPYSMFNEIYWNSIGWNIGLLSLTGERNAEDDGANNTWYENRWSDHPPFVSELYHISGDANAIDGRAMTLHDDIEPLLYSDVSETIVQGNTSAFLTWTFVENFPFSYELYHDGALVRRGYLVWNKLETSLSTLSRGEHNFTLNVRDGYGNSNTSTRILNISQPIILDSYLLAGLSLGSILLVFVIWEKKFRKSV